MAKTAMSMMIEEIDLALSKNKDAPPVLIKLYEGVKERATELFKGEEKQQIQTAYLDGKTNGLVNDTTSSETYYSQTYNS